MTAFYHVCFVVPDLEQAMRDLGRAAGVEWADPVARSLGEWDFRIVFSAGGPPFVELIEGAEDSPWDGTRGARFDHLGFWTSDVELGSRRLAAQGMAEEFSGCPYGRPFVYHRVDSVGARIEFVDAGQQAGFLEQWFPGGAAMPVIDEGGFDVHGFGD